MRRKKLLYCFFFLSVRSCIDYKIYVYSFILLCIFKREIEILTKIDIKTHTHTHTHTHTYTHRNITKIEKGCWLIISDIRRRT